MWVDILVDCCIAVIHSRKALGARGYNSGLAPMPLSIPGKMDALIVLLLDAIKLRESFMETLRRLLTDRQMCLLLIVQVRARKRSRRPASTAPLLPWGGEKRSRIVYAGTYVCMFSMYIAVTIS